MDNFDKHSGPFLERLIFLYRPVFIAICAILTIYLAFSATQLGVNASYQKMMPGSHPYIENYRNYANDLRMLGNAVRIVVADTEGEDIYNPHYLQMLQDINDRVFLLPGVDRAYMQSLWMSSVMWSAVTEEGFEGGPVMPMDYDGTPEAIAELRTNIQRAGLVGDLIALNQRSSMIFVPLLEGDPTSGEDTLDYRFFTEQLLEIKEEYKEQGIDIHVVGFAKLVGDLILGLIQVLTYFGVAAIVVSLVTYWYSRCFRATVVVVSCSLMGVVWQLGIMSLLGFELDPFSSLVPFLVFAIGVSHGAQMMNGTMQNIGKGMHRYVASRMAFRRLHVAGIAALLSDAAGFGVISVIDIPAIRDLALQASIGVAGLVFTNLLLIPVLLSYTGVSKECAERAARAADSHAGEHPVSRFFAKFADRDTAKYVLLGTAVITAAGFVIGQRVQIGDVGAGAPELREDSVYNQDIRFVSENYGLSSDLFAIIVSTPQGGVASFETLLEMDRLEEQLRDLPFVQTTDSASSLARSFTPASFEGDPRWFTLSRDPFLANDAVDNVFTNRPGLINDSRTVAPIVAYLADHKAQTLSSVVNVVEDFAAQHDSEDHKFLLAAGNAGIEAATNQAVSEANYRMLALVYAVVILLCGIAFRSWRAVLVAIIPLAVITILAQAMMAMLGIGLKVATLPVIALGVGIGVDYALYLLTVYLGLQRLGETPREAYMDALVSTGKVVALVGITLTAAVATWIWSPIKFQADMGLLLAFMFLGNMLGALIILPSLATYLLPQKAPKSLQGTEPLDQPFPANTKSGG